MFGRGRLLPDRVQTAQGERRWRRCDALEQIPRVLARGTELLKHAIDAASLDTVHGAGRTLHPEASLRRHLRFPEASTLCAEYHHDAALRWARAFGSLSESRC